MTQSILQYVITTWTWGGGLGIASSITIFMAQKSIIKIIMNKPKLYSTANLFKEFKVFTTKQLFYRKDLHFPYKFDLIKHKPRLHNIQLKTNLDIIIPLFEH